MPALKDEFRSAVSTLNLLRSDATREFHGVKLADPYHYLDDITSSIACAWMDAKEDEYRDFIGDDAARREKERAIAQSLELPEKGIPQKAGDHYLFYYRGAEDKQPRIMVSETAEGPGRPLVDAAEFGPPGAKMIVDAAISPDGKYLGYRIATPGRTWEAELRIRDIATGQDLPDVVKGNGALWWDKDGKGLVYNMETPEKRVALMHHALGSRQEDDTTVYNDPKTNATLANSRFMNHHAYEGPQEWMFVTHTFNAPAAVAMRDPVTGACKTVIAAGLADCAPLADTGDGILMWTKHEAPNGRIVKFDPENPAPENWRTVVPENSRDPLHHAFMHKGRIVTVYGHDCAHAVRIFGKDGAPQGEVPLPGPATVVFSHASLPGVSLGQGAPHDGGGDLMMRVSTFTSPPEVCRFDIGENALMPLDPPPQNSPDLSGCIVEQIWATSRDGTQVPMTVIRRLDVALDGTAAVKLTGYGGFGSTNSAPHLDADIAQHVQAGGIFVQANIRGGGEFGKAWHEGGNLLNKQNSFDDFIACAQLLCERNYTSPKRLVIEGHSNGGLLVLACMEKEPELFGAVIAGAPAADMFSERMKPFHGEYGDPAEEDHFRNLIGYDPVQNVRAGEKYPPLLLRTGIHDEQLLGGALKFIATLGHECPDSVALLHVEKGFGHETARPKDVAAAEIAAKNAFIEKCIGPIDQDEYKLQLSMTAAPALKTRSPA